MSTETELKFQIPAAAREALRAEVNAAGGQPLRLQARYFDTAERALAAAGMALRLRREGERWVQTLKGRGDGVMKRLEHEVALDEAEPALDLSRHDGTPAGAALRRALGDAQPQPTFETDVHRTVLRLQQADALIELALDEGVLRAGAAAAELCELEYELLQGPVQALLALAGEGVLRHGLWLDVRSKAERGERLARGIAVVPPLRLEPESLDTALRQLLANACELADGLGGDEHLEALREAVDAALRAEALLPVATALQALREQLDAVAAHPEAERLPAAGELLRAPGFNRLALELLGAAQG
ncbi:CYTH domain-containing protein [Azohydromonas caseinilytica]|uniref:CYTH domain-containing protein n=1 Tax=Azohydromonas caseinilytica TaxID=2728836 RepID=A0A848F7H4_9BURK|nr:CYTH domain-containing protein [Azohydromonas caseinilytica]NML14011.1 CYTH domain-containing protein [Azohydromonas caseinilytica]